MKKEYPGKSAMRALIKIVQDELKKVKTGIQSAVDTALGEVNTNLDGKLNASEKGAASGVAPLDENGQVPASHLPSYVDDVIDMSYVTAEGETEGKWVLVDPDAGVTEEEIEFKKGKIYLDVDNNISYRWSGTALIDITSPDLEEITADEVQEMWDELAATEEETDQPEGDENA